MGGATSTAWQVAVDHIGAAREPLLVIDDILDDADWWVEDARGRRMAPIGSYYPGVRSPIPAARTAPFVDALRPLVATHFGDGTLSLVEAYYSIVTTAPDALAPIQRLPHFDTTDPRRLALLIYLMPDAAGGTRFYRHRSTDLERVGPDDLAHYEAALQADVAAHGLPDAAYIAGDTPLFAQTAAVAARWNRAALYRSHLLHCADIPPGMTLAADAAKGRLTANMFLELV